MRDVDEIKQKIDVVEYINERVPLKKSGRNFTACCPFHAEKSPSFVVSPDRQIWHCFGACNTGGDIFTFVMRWENIEFPDALKELARLTGVELTTSFAGNKEWERSEKLQAINHLAGEYYHYIFTTHRMGESARDYLTKRKISDKVAQTFMIGYAPAGWRNLFSYLTKKGYQPEEIEEAGLCIRAKNNWYDRFRGRIVFPLKNHRGHIAGFSGRILDANEKGAKYINSPETPLYHKSDLLYGLDVSLENVRTNGYAVICEGEFDVLSSYQAGISNTVAIKGTALAENQLRLLKRFTSEIRLALDMDIAGDTAVRRSIQLADQFDFTVRVVELSHGKDLDEALKKNEHTVKDAVENAVSIYDFIIHSALKRHDARDPYGKKNIVREVVPLVGRITNPIVRNHYSKQLASTLSISEDAIAEELEKIKKRGDKSANLDKKAHEGQKLSQTDRLENHLASLVLQSKDPTASLQFTLKTITIQDIQSRPLRRILMFVGDKTPIPAELKDLYNQLCLVETGAIVTDEAACVKEISITSKKIKKHALRRKLAELSTKLEEQPFTKDEEEEIRRITAALQTLERIPI